VVGAGTPTGVHSRDAATADVVGGFAVSSALGFGRQPQKVPSPRHEPVKVASIGGYDTVIFTESHRTSHRYGSGTGEKPENTVDGKVSAWGVADELEAVDPGRRRSRCARGVRGRTLPAASGRWSRP
jgi:hypothetical protein